MEDLPRGTVRIDGVQDNPTEFRDVTGAVVVAVSAGGQIHMHCSLPPEALADICEALLERYRRPQLRAMFRSSDAQALATKIIPASIIPGGV